MTLASVVITAAMSSDCCDHERRVVVDVAVQHRHQVGRIQRRPVLLQAVEGVGVGLRDRPDAGPAGVPEDRGPGGVGLQRPAEQWVVENTPSDGGDVVAQLPDLGGGLVDKTQGARERSARRRR